MLVLHMKTEGKSFQSFGAIANVSKQTLFNWVKRHEEFKEAKALGEIYSLAYWEDMGSAGTFGRLVYTSEEVVDQAKGTITRKKKKASFNPFSYQLIMMNRFKWRKGDPDQVTDEISPDLLGALEALEAEEMGNKEQKTSKKVTKKASKVSKKVSKTNRKTSKVTKKV